MADNVAITAGSGTSIATDDCAGAHYQKMKLYDGTADSTTAIAGDATNGLDVDVTRVLPGTTASALGKAEDAAHTTGDVGVMMLGVRNDADAAISGTDLDYTPIATSSAGKVLILRDLQRISVQSGGLTTATTAYAVGDQVGNQFTLANAARISGGGGIITGVVLISAADIIGAYDVVITDSSITLAADNAAYAISDADALKIVSIINLAGAYDIGNNRVAQIYNLAVPYVCSGGTSLFAGLITRGAHTFFGATTDLQLIVYVERY